MQCFQFRTIINGPLSTLTADACNFVPLAATVDECASALTPVSTAATVLAQRDDTATKAAASVDRELANAAASYARSAREQHLIWESHLRSLSSATIQEATVRNWVKANLLEYAPQTSQLSSTLMWMMFTRDTGKYAARSVVAPMLRRALASHCRLASTKCDGSCGTRWRHVHGVALRPSAETDLAVIRNDVVRLLGRLQFERGTVACERPTRSERLAHGEPRRPPARRHITASAAAAACQ